MAVLPIDTFGGPQGTVTELLFEKKELVPKIIRKNNPNYV